MPFFSRRRRGQTRHGLLSRLEREVREEIRFYLEMRVRGLEAEGIETEEAWRQALEAFGDPEEVINESTVARGGDPGVVSGRELMLSVMQDLAFALRTLWKRPLFAAAAVISLGLGIGANTAAFSVMNSLLVRPLNVAEPSKLIPVFTSQTGDRQHGNTAYPDYLDYRDRNEVFSGLAAHTTAPMAVGGDGPPRVVWGQLVSWDYFQVLGVDPLLGRGFLREEGEEFGAYPVAVLSHSAWQDQFGSDPEILGRTVRINDSPFTVIGVAPAGFMGLMPVLYPALWAPLAMTGQALPYSPAIQSRGDPWLQLVGRLEDGVSVADAQAAMDVLAANLAAEFPMNRNKGIVLGELDTSRILSPEITSRASTLLTVLFGVVGFVLLVACFNVANLQLAKATARRREIALRFSLGASRTRIVRQLLVESTVLALLAGGLGLILANLALDGLRMFQPRMEVPLELPFSLDLRVLGFTFLLAAITGIVFGLAPALQVLRPGQSDALKDQGHGTGQARSSSRIQNSLVVAQVALSLVLLAASGLFMRSLSNTLAIDPGFDFPNGIVMPMNLGYGQFDEEDGRALHRRLLDRVRSMPEVESAALTAFAPLGTVHGRHWVDVEGYARAPEESMLVMRNMVSSDYFETMGVRVLRGRAIDERDTEEAEPVAVVNETMAERYWPGQDPIGRTVRADLGITYTVVGIIEDGRYVSVQETPEPYLVLPMTQAEYWEGMSLAVSARGNVSALVPRLLAEVREIVPELPPTTAMTGSEHLAQSVGNAKAPAIMVGAFGILALVLATVGLYGVMWYTVSQRTREFGVRLALGASEREVVKMVLRGSLRMTLVGVVIGLVLALGVTQVLSSLLYQVGVLDPLVFSLVPAVLLGVGLLAGFLPARHAAKADAVVVLRAE